MRFTLLAVAVSATLLIVDATKADYGSSGGVYTPQASYNATSYGSSGGLYVPQESYGSHGGVSVRTPLRVRLQARRAAGKAARVATYAPAISYGSHGG